MLFKFETKKRKLTIHKDIISISKYTLAGWQDVRYFTISESEKVLRFVPKNKKNEVKQILKSL